MLTFSTFDLFRKGALVSWLDGWPLNFGSRQQPLHTNRQQYYICKWKILLNMIFGQNGSFVLADITLRKKENYGKKCRFRRLRAWQSLLFSIKLPCLLFSWKRAHVITLISYFFQRRYNIERFSLSPHRRFVLLTYGVQKVTLIRLLISRIL